MIVHGAIRRLVMTLPNLNASQVEWVVREVMAYIESQRQTFRCKTTPLSREQMAMLQPFFPASTLDAARVITLAVERVGNPPFYGALVQMGFEPAALPDFSHMAAITFVDAVVSHEPFTYRLLFHELVHVVQYEKLGLPEFAAKYVRGFLSGGSYGAIPLEINAYELEARFADQPAKPFSVADEVQRWIETKRF
jgi:hypothetical protein